MIRRLSPHDLAHFHTDWCQRCWWLAKNYNLKPPRAPFPDVVNVADKQMKAQFAGMDLSWLGIPSVARGAKKTWVQSKPVAVGGIQVEVAGFYDELGDREDGSVDVIDFKMTIPKPVTAQRYEPQLNAYAYALENPAEGPAVKVAGLWLICWEPGEMAISQHLGHPQPFMGALTAVPVQRRPDLTEELMVKHANILAGPLPQPSPECPLCGYMSLAAQTVKGLKPSPQAEAIAASARSLFALSGGD